MTQPGLGELRIGRTRYIKYDKKTFIDFRYKDLFDYLSSNFTGQSKRFYTLHAQCGGVVKLSIFRCPNIDATAKAIYLNDCRSIKESISTSYYIGMTNSLRHLAAYNDFYRFIGKFSDLCLIIGNLLDGSIDALVPKFIEYNKIPIGISDPQNIINNIESFYGGVKKTASRISGIDIGICSSIRIREVGQQTYQYGIGISGTKQHVPDIVKDFVKEKVNSEEMKGFMRECKRLRDGLGLKLEDFSSKESTL